MNSPHILPPVVGKKIHMSSSPSVLHSNVENLLLTQSQTTDPIYLFINLSMNTFISLMFYAILENILLTPRRATSRYEIGQCPMETHIDLL